MTIADRIRKLAEDSSVPGDIYEYFLNIAEELDAKAHILITQYEGIAQEKKIRVTPIKEIAESLGDTLSGKAEA